MSLLSSCLRPSIRFLASVLATILVTAPAHAEFPYPACGGCADPNDYKDYMHTAVVAPPVRPNEIGQYDFRASSLVDPSLPNTPEELGGVAGMSIDTAWQLTTGRPDVTVAHLDSGIRYDHDNVRKAALNQAELPLPEGSLVYDKNGDGVFNINDYATDSRVSDVDGNGIRDPRDLILVFSDGVDDDANGYVDDICGWDTHEHDNDPFDDADYGHGTGESKDSSGEVNDGGSWGVAPNAMFVPIKVSDSFVADGNDFGAGVAYALDRGVSVISEALGALNNTKLAQNAVEYAFEQGVPMVLSAADEQSYHHNFPAVYTHGFWANSVRPKDGTAVTNPTNLLLNGCTNYSGRADAAIASNSCSSEATGRAAGIFALMLARAKNQIELGAISPHPSGKPLSPTEIYQLMRMTADDIDFSAVSPTLTPAGTLLILFPDLIDERFPSHAGFDKYFGYGRANVRTAIEAIDAGTIPPEADIQSPAWFVNVDPTVTPILSITGTAAAQRDANNASYVVDWACGVDPLESDFAMIGHTIASAALGGTPIENSLLATFDTAAAAAECGFASLTLPRTNEDDFDESYAVTIRVTVQDSLGNVGQARRNVTLEHDSSLMPGFPIEVGVSGDSAPLLHDMDGDGAQEIIFGAADGKLHILDGSGSELAGWPVETNPMQLASSASFAPLALGNDYHSSILAGVAIGDVDNDGDDEVVAADMDGSVYVFRDDGTALPGFPVSLNPVYSDPAIRNEANRLDYGVLAAPTLADLDGDGTLEILVAAMDRHLYVWNSNGTTHAGFPVLIVDQDRMSSVNATNHQVTWKLVSGQPVGSIGTKLLSSPSVGDLDGDGHLEIVLGSNEEYVRGETSNFFISNPTFGLLSNSLDNVNGRIYAVSRFGNDDPALVETPNASGPFLEGWPARLGMLTKDLLPTVGHGVTAAPALADVDDDGDDEVFINGNNGPAYLLQGTGLSYFGSTSGKYNVFNPSLTLASNPDASSDDFPLTFALLSSGAVGDFFSNGTLDFALPSVGAHQLVDNQGPAFQGPGDHQLMAWSASDGHGLPAFPQREEDLQFLSSPAVADIDGDSIAELLQGSGGYYLHAFRAGGGEPAGWPKFTGGWMVGAATAGDIDNNGTLDVVAITREGNLYAWGTGASYERSGTKSVQWATVSRDIHRSGNLNSGVATSSGECTSEYRSMLEKVSMKYPTGAGNDKLQIKGFVNTAGRGFDPVANSVEITIGSPDTPEFNQLIPAASFTGNTSNTSYKFSADAPGVTKVSFKLKKGIWKFQVKASEVDASPADERVFLKLRIGDVCIERTRICEPNDDHDQLKCKKPKL
ncbi:MAG TPA: FG-GAP-like repeat-containing protein [Candidatus Limnocylindrales bacterium]|nr:FG-GAP-like repeat-containing protein [Candidatus Limnocylindrales bacterium]